ncbi:TPA: PH domain-containing protein [Candidatus Woesearchaeota archaeon]|nr:PH domain-containing protein [Candidatus Woesearchaeota archaeon]
MSQHKEGAHEEVIMSLYRSRKAFLLEYGCAVILLLLWLAVQIKRIHLNDILTYGPLVVIAGTLISAESSRVLHRSTITSSKIVIVDGLLKVRKRHVFITSINDVDTKQTRLQRLLGFGNIHVRTASGENLELKDINNPEEVMELLEGYLTPPKK